MQGRIVHVLLVSVGYACFLALNSFSLWGFDLLPRQALGEQASSSWGASLALSNAVSFFILAVCSALGPARFARSIYPLACASTLSAMACVAGFLLAGPLVFVAAGGALMGFATTCFFFCWLFVFRHEGPSFAQVEIIAGSVLSAVPFIAFFTLDSSAISMTLCILAMATIGFFALEMKGATVRFSVDVDRRQGPRGRLLAVRGLWRACLCCFAVGFMAPVVSGLSDVVFGEMNLADQAFLVHSENVLAALVVGVSWIALKKRPDTVRAFSVLFPLLTTAFLAFLFVPAFRGAVPYIGGVAFVVCSMTVLIESVSAEDGTDGGAGFSYGLRAGVLYAANAFGNFVVGRIGISMLGEASMMLVVVVLLYGCSIVLYFITRKDPREDKGFSADGASAEDLREAREGASSASKESASYDEAFGLASRMIGEQQGLTERQIEVLALLARGYTVSAAAAALYLSENTVRTHAKKIYAALDIHSKQELIELVAEAAERV